MQTRGWYVLRFWNNEVVNNLDGVLSAIAEHLTDAPHPDLPLSMRKEKNVFPSMSPGYTKGEGEGGGSLLTAGTSTVNVNPHPDLPPERGKEPELWRTFLLLPFIAFQLFIHTAIAAPQFPALNGRVVDEAGILTPGFKSEISAQLAAYEQATTNQVVVVTLKSLQGYDISDFGYQLGRHWGVGRKGKNNGALLIVAPTERKLRIEAGYGLEGVLTDAVSRDIIERAIKPPFRQQNYEQGIRAGVGAMLAVLDGETSTLPPPVTAVGNNQNFDYLFFLFFLAPLLMRFGRARGGKKSSLTSRLGMASVFGAAAGGIFWFFAQIVLLAIVVGFVVFVIALLARGQLGDGGHYGGGSGGGWSGGDSGGFSGGGGSFGGGGASGDW